MQASALCAVRFACRKVSSAVRHASLCDVKLRFVLLLSDADAAIAQRSACGRVAFVGHVRLPTCSPYVSVLLPVLLWSLQLCYVGK
jgi:hypothetical protein